uniref:RNA-binding protein NOB1 n=1 Tax=Glossina pallidipes TaxID=7398 RepID=A0A3F2Z485_GLOPL
MNKKIKYLVADTTAFINAVPLNEYADNVLTVPEVVSEVRNKRQIKRLCVLPYDLQVREPRIESVKHCVQFSKKTGDYISLSGIDIKVIALAYELEADMMGTDHLRKEPIMSTIIASKERPQELQDNTKLPGWYNGDCDDSGSESEEEPRDADEQIDDYTVDQVKANIEKELKICENEKETEDVTERELEDLFDKLICDANDDTNENLCDNLALNPESGEDDKNARQNERTSENDSLFTSIDTENDGNWITPNNIQKVKQSMMGKVENDMIPQVACMSTDFAVQNTLKQMNLNITNLNGCTITHMRTYILRCYACFKTTSVITKVFCPNCGNKTLKRVAVSLDENGKQMIHINTRRPLTRKYKNKSIPRFRGGKHSHNPILFEDQPIPRQMPSRVARTKTNALDEDYIAGLSPFAMRDVDSKSALLRSKGHVKECARNSNYEENRRRKQHNRLCK